MHIVETLAAAGAANSDLEELERLLRTSLPKDYRDFLAETNGGRPEPSAFTFQQYGRRQESLVDWFFTLDASEEQYQLLRENEILLGRIPARLLPIACDPFGNILLLDLGAKSIGAVYFWDHENENMEGEPYWDNISYIAASFMEFVTSVHLARKVC